MVSFNKKTKPKTKPDVDDEDDAPVAKKKKAAPANDEDDDDAPPVKKSKKAKASDEDDDDTPPFDTDDEDDTPPKKKSKKADDEDEDEETESDDDADEDDEDETPPKKKSKAKDEDDDEEDADDEDSDDEEEDEAPAKKSKKVAKDEDESEDDEEDEAPARKAKTKVKDADDESDEAPRKSFLKTGSAARAQAESEAAKAKLRDERSGKMFHFFIHKDKIDKDFPITFLDGNLDEKGAFFVNNPTYYQHSQYIGGRLTHFASPCEDEVDPLQEAGVEPAFVQAFTIIDHAGYTDRDGVKHPYQKRLFVAKSKTQKQLLKIAKKRGGLKGVTLEVTRTGNKEPNVGNIFEFVGKQKISEFMASLKEEGVFKEEKDATKRDEKLRALVSAADYEKEIVQYSAKDIKRMGLVQNVKQLDGKASNSKAKDIDDELDD
jgi:hypothetical protein